MSRSKAAILAELVALCNELEVLPGDASQWIATDLVESQLLDSMRLLQLEALLQEEFGLRVRREDFAAWARTLDGIAERIAASSG